MVITGAVEMPVVEVKLKTNQKMNTLLVGMLEVNVESFP